LDCPKGMTVDDRVFVDSLRARFFAEEPGHVNRSSMHLVAELPRGGDGRLARLMNAWSKVEVLILDDFLIRPISPDAASDTLEVIEDRHGLRSTILTSQLPVANWYASIGDPTIADALLDRLTTNLHRIELNGESMRKVVPLDRPTGIRSGRTPRMRKINRRSRTVTRKEVR
jgi:hypothetical protein